MSTTDSLAERPVTPKEPTVSKPADKPHPLSEKEAEMAKTIDSLGGRNTADPDRTFRTIDSSPNSETGHLIEQAREKGKFKPLSIQELPEKAQKIAQASFKKVEIEADKVGDIKIKAESDIKVYREKSGDLQEIRGSFSTPSTEAKTQEDAKLALINQEFTLLQTGFAKLAKGEDAPELREISSVIFDDKKMAEHFSPAETEQFKRKTGFISGIQEKLSRLTKRQGESKSELHQRMGKLLSARGANLLGYIEAECMARTVSEVQEVQATDQRKEGLLKSSVEQPFEKTLVDYMDGLRRASGKIVPDAYYLGQLRNWVTANQDQMKQILESGNPDEMGKIMIDSKILGTRVQVEKSNRSATEFINRLQTETVTVPQQAIVSRLNSALEQIAAPLREVYETTTHLFPGKGNMDRIEYTGMVQEFIDVNQRAQSQKKELSSAVAEFTGKEAPAETAQPLEQYVALQIEEATSNLARGENMLLHGAPFDKLKNMLKTGLLASRKTQIDRFGKSEFNSSSMTVGKDYVEIGSQRMSIDEYNKQSAALGRMKHADQESHLVSFSKNTPYGLTYTDGVSLVFSQAQLFARSQFTETDGWQLFDENYDDQDLNSPGFSIDLTKEPMIMLVSDTRKKDFINFVKTELAQEPAWKDAMADPDKWMEENVVFLPPNAQHNGREYPQPIQAEIKQKLFGRHADPEKIGRVHPTGNMGETVGGMSALYTYDLAA